MKIKFLGAAGEVTGSCFLVQTGNIQFLVDCGMLQGGREAPIRNRQPFGFDPSELDFVLLTHAHIDHSGMLPKLIKAGYSGYIYATSATADLLDVLLPDSAHIQEIDAERASRKPRSQQGRHYGLTTPVYTMTDALQTLNHIKEIDYATMIDLAPGIKCRYQDAGHILGSAIIEIWITEGETTRKIVFSGDLGQPGRPILRDPTLIEEADILIMESTYGDRPHRTSNSTEEEIVEIFNRTLPKGNIIIPAFAVGRTQEVIYGLLRLARHDKVNNNLKVFVDSPMATKATAITMKHIELFDEEAKKMLSWKKIGTELPNLYFTESVEESQMLNKIRSGAIIISASGMCDAGRIKHHLRHNLGREECAIMITGFQAMGSLGRRLVDGVKRVRIFGEEINVRASIHTVGGLSAHADQPALINWAKGFKKPPKHTYLVHGEANPAEVLASRLENELNWNVYIPKRHESITFD